MHTVVDRFEREEGMSRSFTAMLTGLAKLALGGTRIIGYHSVERILRCDTCLDSTPSRYHPPPSFAPSAPPPPQSRLQSHSDALSQCDAIPMADPVGADQNFPNAVNAGAVPVASPVFEPPFPSAARADTYVHTHDADAPQAHARRRTRDTAPGAQVEACGMLTVRDGELVLMPAERIAQQSSRSSLRWLMPWTWEWSRQQRDHDQLYVAKLAGRRPLRDMMLSSRDFWWRIKWATTILAFACAFGPTWYVHAFPMSAERLRKIAAAELSQRIIQRARQIRRPAEPWRGAVERARRLVV